MYINVYNSINIYVHVYTFVYAYMYINMYSCILCVLMNMRKEKITALQRVAVCCSEHTQTSTYIFSVGDVRHSNVCVVVCCNVLQCVAVCGSVLQ